MADIISFEQKRFDKFFDRNDDPCSSCTDDKKNCTCERADLWWKTLANQLKGR